MTTKTQQPKLRIRAAQLHAHALAPVPPPADAPTGGLGLDYDDVPEHLGEVGRVQWTLFASALASNPTYLREVDRPGLTSCCEAMQIRQAAWAQMVAAGVVVEGRSSPDRGRQVRHPSFQIWRDADARVQQWLTMLGLSKAVRLRGGEVAESDSSGEDNPFMAPAS